MFLTNKLKCCYGWLILLILKKKQLVMKKKHFTTLNVKIVTTNESYKPLMAKEKGSRLFFLRSNSTNFVAFSTCVSLKFWTNKEECFTWTIALAYLSKKSAMKKKGVTTLPLKITTTNKSYKLFTDKEKRSSFFLLIL